MNTDRDTYSEFDILIVGAGLVGASLACAIARTEKGQTQRIAVIEAGGALQTFTGEQFDPRVVALTQSSARLLERIGAWADIMKARVCAYQDMHVWDGEGTAEIHFSSAEVRQPCLGFIVENSLALAGVREQLNSCANITLIQPASVIALHLPEAGNANTRIELDNGRVLQAPLAIAADGARSQVRDLAGFETREWDYGQSAIVTTVRTEQPHQFTAWQRFMQTGPVAFLPLQREHDDDARYCSIVWSADETLAKELMALDDEGFCQRLAAAFEYKLGAVEGCAERFCIPLRQRHAPQYIKPGIALVGDAAHNIHPLAGQGVNLGLLDAAALAAEIERALMRGIPLGDFSLLRRYQRQRLGDNLGMMSAMEAFKRLFGSRSLSIILLRNMGVHRLASLPLLKNYLVKRAMGL